MSRCKAILVTLVFIAVCASSVSGFTGTMTTSNGMSGTGAWINDNGDAGWFPASLTWVVTNPSIGVWHYDYTLSVFKGGVSHFILEVSPSFTAADLSNAMGDFTGGTIIDTYSAGGSNPGMPGTIYGIKFDSAFGTTANFNFDSDRAPVWGDFYSKDGKAGSTDVFNAVWNSGLTSPDTDPTAPPANGVLQGHILVPDSNSGTVVPEQPSLLLALMGVAIGPLQIIRRRK